MSLTCAIAITTHNRIEDLKATLAEILRLRPAPDELLVCVDACTDGTEAFLREHYPQCRLLVNPVSMGSVGSRDALFRKAESDLILSLDDDSHPVETDFIEQVCLLFESTPRLAVATFPQRSDEYPESLAQSDFGPRQWVGSFTSSGAAIRRGVFLELGGYPAVFHHAYEEPDFALRCIAAGYRILSETSLHIRHCYSGVQRNEMRTHHFHARNELWSVFMRCPLPQCFGVALFRLIRQFGYASKRGLCWVLQEPAWWGDCLSGIGDCMVSRKPLPWSCYREWMRLVRHPRSLQNETKEDRP